MLPAALIDRYHADAERSGLQLYTDGAVWFRLAHAQEDLKARGGGPALT